MLGTKINKTNLDYKAYFDAAVWANENNAFIEDCGEFFEVKGTPAKTLKELQAEKMDELRTEKRKFDDNLVCAEMVIVSSIGIKANADLRSQNNIAGLITALPESGKTIFRDAENVNHEIGIQELHILQREFIENGQNLYIQAWKLESEIKAAKTIDDLNKIKIEFTQTDFSAS